MTRALTVDAARQAVSATCRELAARGLVSGRAGNVSARAGEALAVSPTGAVLATLEPADVAVVGMDGQPREGSRAPTSEIGLHLGAYQRDGVGAVIHTHAPAATAVACALEELPIVHYELLALGGPIRVAPYATNGTPALAEAVLAALDGRRAALMANHGTLTLGTDLADALRATEILEWCCALYLRASTLGPVKVLDTAAQAELADVAAARASGRVGRAG